MKVFLYGHNGSGNHGCEAIVRGTHEVLKKLDSSLEITLASGNKNEDAEYGLNEIVYLVDEKNNVKKLTPQYIKAYFSLKLFKNYLLSEELCYKKTFDNVSNDTISLSIGGDNYCYPGYQRFMMLHDMVHRRGVKTVLWGCSVEPSKINDEMKEDLLNYDLITARETLTYDALKKIGANVVLCSDPAFQLQKVELHLPNNFILNNTVGINISPMIINNEMNKGAAFENYKNLINYILNETDMNVALIPHVIWEDNNDDRIPCKELYELFKHTNRVCLIDDHNCMELKGYISRCRFFVGARTHSTIAAYSTCVPTLVVGYSVKAKGIAKDIFGTYENYVLPVQSLKEPNDLINSFKWMYNHEDSIRKHLIEFMPEYKEKALIAGEKLKELISR